MNIQVDDYKASDAKFSVSTDEHGKFVKSMPHDADGNICDKDDENVHHWGWVDDPTPEKWMYKEREDVSESIAASVKVLTDKGSKWWELPSIANCLLDLSNVHDVLQNNKKIRTITSQGEWEDVTRKSKHFESDFNSDFSIDAKAFCGFRADDNNIMVGHSSIAENGPDVRWFKVNVALSTALKDAVANVSCHPTSLGPGSSIMDASIDDLLGMPSSLPQLVPTFSPQEPQFLVVKAMYKAPDTMEALMRGQTSPVANMTFDGSVYVGVSGGENSVRMEAIPNAPIKTLKIPVPNRAERFECTPADKLIVARSMRALTAEFAECTKHSGCGSVSLHSLLTKGSEMVIIEYERWECFLAGVMFTEARIETESGYRIEVLGVTEEDDAAYTETITTRDKTVMARMQRMAAWRLETLKFDRLPMLTKLWTRLTNGKDTYLSTIAQSQLSMSDDQFEDLASTALYFAFDGKDDNHIAEQVTAMLNYKDQPSINYSLEYQERAAKAFLYMVRLVLYKEDAVVTIDEQGNLRRTLIDSFNLADVGHPLLKSGDCDDSALWATRLAIRLGLPPFGKYGENGQYEGTIATKKHLMAIHNALFHMVFTTAIVSATSAQANDRNSDTDGYKLGGHMTTTFIGLPQMVDALVNGQLTRQILVQDESMTRDKLQDIYSKALLSPDRQLALPRMEISYTDKSTYKTIDLLRKTISEPFYPLLIDGTTTDSSLRLQSHDESITAWLARQSKQEETARKKLGELPGMDVETILVDNTGANSFIKHYVELHVFVDTEETREHALSAHEFAVAPMNCKNHDVYQCTGASVDEVYKGNFALIAFDPLDKATGAQYDDEVKFVQTNTLPPTTPAHNEDIRPDNINNASQAEQILDELTNTYAMDCETSEGQPHATIHVPARTFWGPVELMRHLAEQLKKLSVRIIVRKRALPSFGKNAMMARIQVYF